MNGNRQRSWMCTLSAVLLSALLVGTASDAGAWATITVNSLADPGSPGICTLRDAITAANSMSPTNGCAAGNGHDTIRFSITGTISLVETLPAITDSLLTINGPPSPGITISGGDAVRVMQVASGVTVHLKNVTIAHGLVAFSNDLNEDIGAGILSTGTLTIDNCTFSSNNAALAGGGISNNGGTLQISNSTFSGNSANSANAGGGAIDNQGTLAIENSTFSGNHAFQWGGGIFNRGQVTVTNSTLSGNTVSDGGGAFYSLPISGGSLTVINSTIFGNRAAVFGGAIEASGAVSVRSSIFSANSAGGPSISNTCAATIIDLGYNISDDDTCGFTATGSLNNTDAMLDPAGLSNNGGPTQTIALLSGSPAIDAIPLADCTNGEGNRLKTDQRGFPRPDADEQVCDIGAYEFQAFDGTPGTKNCQGVSVSALAREFGNIKAAASALHFASVQALQNAIRAFCKG